MAQGWDAYFQNLDPLSSDATAAVADGSIPQQIENLIVDHDFPNTAPSQDAPDGHASLNANFLTDTSADCDYQKYYGETPWISGGQHIMKDCLPSCGNGNSSDFASDELSLTEFPDFQDLKQDCEMLTSSFNDDYSDVKRELNASVNRDSDETRPSCKFLSISDQTPKTTGTTKHLSSEWTLTSTENISFSHKVLCPNIPVTVSPLSNTSNVKSENIVQCCPSKSDELLKPCPQNDQTPDMLAKTVNEHFKGHNDESGQPQPCQEDQSEKRADTLERDFYLLTNTICENVQNGSGNREDCSALVATDSLAKSESFELVEAENLTSEKMESIKRLNNHSNHKDIINPIFTNGQNDEDESHVQDKDIQTLAIEFGCSGQLQVVVNSEQCKRTSKRLQLDLCVQRDGGEQSVKQEGEVIGQLIRRAEEGETPLSNTKSPDLKSVKMHDVTGTVHKLGENPTTESTSEDDASCLQSACKLNESKAIISVCPDSTCSSASYPADINGEENTTAYCLACLPRNDSKTKSKHFFPTTMTSKAHQANITSSTGQKHSLQAGPIATEAGILHRDVAEKSRPQDLSSKEKQLNELYGECHSKEKSACPATKIMSMTSQLEAPPSAPNNNCNGKHAEDRTSQLKSSEQMRRHLQPVVVMKTIASSDTTDISYYCAICHLSTLSVDQLIEHHHCSHLKDKFLFCQTCNIYLCNDHLENRSCDCFLDFTSQKGRATRKKNHTYECNKCILVFDKVNDYVRHMRVHTGKTPFKCNQCYRYFSQSSSLFKHQRMPGRCKGKKFTILGTSSAPSDEAKTDYVVAETKADVSTTGKKQNEDRLHSSPVSSLPECYVKVIDIFKNHVCHYCGKEYQTSIKLKKHYSNVHQKCGGTGGSLQHDQKVDHGKPSKIASRKMSCKYQCPLCPRLFKYSHNRARHLRDCVKRAMWGGKGKIGGRYKCPLCPSLFTSLSNRHRHVKQICIKECLFQLAQQRANFKTSTDQSVSAKVGYKCNFCPAVFAHKSGKSRHMKKHEVLKNTGKLLTFRRSNLSLAPEPSISSASVTLSTVKAEVCNEASLPLTCRFCGKRFTSLMSLRKHQYYHKGEKPYRCLECGKKFKRRAHLIAHKVIHQRRVQCTVCRKILPTIADLIQHRNSHPKKGMLKCPDCPLEFQYPAFLLRHSATHKKVESKKPQAIKTQPSQTQLSSTSLEDQEVLNHHQCSLCQKIFDEAQALRKHCLKHITRCSSYRCPFCKKSFTCRRNLVRHMIVHSGGKPLSCSTCDKRFLSSRYLRLHLEKCSPGDLKCLTTCSADDTPKDTDVNDEKGLPKKPNYTVTTESDRKSKELMVCSYCPRVFCRRNRLRNHHRAHKAYSLLCCLNCGQYFGHTKLTSHQKTCLQTQEQRAMVFKDVIEKQESQVAKSRDESQSSTIEVLQHQCPHCPQRFKYRSILLRHVVSHTGLQPYSCMHCSHRFASQSMCLQHEAFCDGVYRAEQTNAKSGVASHLSNTSNFTEPLKAQTASEFKCKFCTKTFLKSRNLRHHILTHTEVKPYHCKTCDCCFSRYDHLKVHQAHCKGRRQRLEVCLPKISLDDIGTGWQDKLVRQSPEKHKTHDCHVCSRKFSAQSELSRHLTMVHVPGLFQCTRCGNSYNYEKSLKKHRKKNKCRRTPEETKAIVHSLTENVTEGLKSRILQRLQPFNKKYKHVCSYCPRAFYNSWQLRVHTRLHTGEKPYRCDDCGEKFIRNDYLQRHTLKCPKRMQQQPRVLCEICGIFLSKDKIRYHKESCTVLNPASPQITNLTPSKGYSCAYCASHFLLFSQLQEHFLNEHKQEALSSPAVSAVPLQQHLSNLGRIKDEPLERKCDKLHSGTSNVLCNLDPCLEAEIHKPFSCPDCHLRFINKAGLMGHLRVHAKSYPFNCKTCKRGFWNKNLLRNHSRKCLLGSTLKRNAIHLNKPPQMHGESSQTAAIAVLPTNYLCDNKRDDFPLQTSKKQDPTNLSTEKVVQYQCSECEKSFTDGLLLISHLEDHGRQEQEKKRNTCPKCGRVCLTQANLERHMRIHGIKDKYSCPDCSKKFDTLSEFEIHRTCHDPNRSFGCRVCNQRFLSKSNLLSHYTEEHPNDIFSCRFCKRIYSAKKSLLKHYRVFHKNEVYDGNTDEICYGKGNLEQPSSPDSSTDESDDHDGDESSNSSDSDPAPYFPCHVCGKTFVTSESLEDHQRCHLGEKPHECGECGKCFYQASQLQQHQRMHKSEFQCQTCGRGFVSLFALRKHKHSHGKSRPYRCGKCQLSFTGQAQLAEHMSKHREETFPCDICNCIFSTKSTRAEHRKIHISAGGSVLSSHPLTKPKKCSSPPHCSSVSAQLKNHCRICRIFFEDPQGLSNHVCKDIIGKGQLHSCLNSDHVLQASHPKQHQMTHSHPTHLGLYLCTHCSLKFSSSKHFLNHLKNHSDTDFEVQNQNGSNRNMKNLSGVFICPICQLHFSKAADLIRHFDVHSESAFPGKVCKTFLSKNCLDEHDHCHLKGSTEFDCAAYGPSSHKQSPENTHLHQSVRIPSVSPEQTKRDDEEVDVIGDDLHCCPVCAKRYSSQSSLLEHQNNCNPNGKPFQCKYCGKAFALRRYKKEHERRHCLTVPAEKKDHFVKSRFKCSQCSKIFKSTQDLSLHMRIHAERQIGQYRCDMCFKSFTAWSFLKRHQESHVGQVVYECTECDKAFAFPHLLEEHQCTYEESSVKCSL